MLHSIGCSTASAAALYSSSAVQQQNHCSSALQQQFIPSSSAQHRSSTCAAPALRNEKKWPMKTLQQQKVPSKQPCSTTATPQHQQRSTPAWHGSNLLRASARMMQTPPARGEVMTSGENGLAYKMYLTPGHKQINVATHRLKAHAKYVRLFLRQRRGRRRGRRRWQWWPAKGDVGGKSVLICCLLALVI